MEKPGKKISVVIVAGGNGSRMGTEIPKQLLPLCGKPVIVRTIEKFREVLPGARLYVALSKSMAERWAPVEDKYGLSEFCSLCEGGETRSHTVRNALKVMEPCEVVLIHDAVRPLIDERLIAGVVRTALGHGTAVPVVRPVDSFREICDDGNSRSINRDMLRTVQTPQGFRYELLKDAYERHFCDKSTDDACIVEQAGYQVALCEGSLFNIKITHPEDMRIAEALLKCEK